MSVMTKPKSIAFNILAAALLFSILLVPAARADLVSVSQYNGLALPAVGEGVHGEFNPINLEGPGLASYSDSNGSGVGSGGAGSQDADPAVFAAVSCCNTNNPNDISWGAYGNILYAFEITGPDVLSPTAVVDVWSNGGVSAQGQDGDAAALLAITDVSGNSSLQGPLLTESIEACAGENAGCFPTPENSFTLANRQITVRVGDVILVQAQAGAATLGSGNFSAYVDPKILLDPSDSPGLSLVFSPGIQQPSSPPVSPVPEPSTEGLLSVGTALAACQLLRKRTIKRQSL